MMFSLLSDEAGLHLSTMKLWLAGKPPYDLTMFANHSKVVPTSIASPTRQPSARACL